MTDATSRLVPGWLADYHRTTREATTSALAVIPLMLVYGVGLLFASPGARSGVDPVSQTLRRQLTEDGYLGVQLGLAGLILLLAAWRLRRATGRRLALTAPLVVEASVYGVFMGGAIVWVLDRAELLAVGLDLGTLVDRAVTSAGAGLHEELLFRLALIPLLTLLCGRIFELSRGGSVVIAVALSSLLFAGAHHLASEPVELYVFAYRTLAGVLFATLFLTRGFGVAAWAHASYDFYVLGL